MYYVYILQSTKDKSYYTGYTTDLKKQFIPVIKDEILNETAFKIVGNTGKELEKYDTHFIVESVEIYASLILHANNPYKEELVDDFLSQVDEYNKDE